MSRNDFITITGANDVQKILEDIAPRHAKNLLRSTVHAVASEVGKQAKINAKQYKDTGLLLRSIKWKRKKSPAHAPQSVVYVNKEAYYWRFVEYGTKGNPSRGMPPLEERPIFRKAEHDLRPRLPAIYAEQFGKKLEALMKRELKKKNGI